MSLTVRCFFATDSDDIVDINVNVGFVDFDFEGDGVELKTAVSTLGIQLLADFGWSVCRRYQ